MTQDAPDPDDPRTYGLRMTKRRFMALLGGGAAVSSAVALDDDGEIGNLWGGTMALSQAFKVASGERDWYQGPDSVKDDITGQNGDRYSATDVQIEYYWDGGWTALGVGSSGTKAPASHFQSLSTERLNTNFYFVNEYATGGDGTESSPWTDGFNEAMDDIPTGHQTDDQLVALVCPPGHYELTTPVQMKKGIRRRDADSDANEENVFPPVIGWGMYSTNFLLADGVNDSMFKFDIDTSIVDTDENVIGGGIRGVTMMGNNPNNTAGDCIEIISRSDNGLYVQQTWRDLFLRHSQDACFADRSGTLNEQDFRSCWFNRPQSKPCVQIGTDTTAGGRFSFTDCWFSFAENTNHGTDMNIGGTGEATFVGCRWRNNSNVQCQFGGGPAQFVGCEWVIDSGDATGNSNDQVLINNRGDDVYYHGYVDGGGSTTDGIQDQSGTDARFDVHIIGVTNEFAGTSTRTVLNGRLIAPDTESLGGTDGTVSPTAVDLDTVPVKVDAGGSITELEGIGGALRREGQTVRVIHTGGENVTVVHDDTAETDPLILSGGSNVTLGTNGDMIEFTYSTTASKWIQTGLLTSQ